MDYSAFHWSEKARKQAERAKEIVDSIGSVLHYKGSVATRADLPILGQVLGDMYNILSDGSNVVWNGSDWDDISGVVDLSAYRTASDQDTIDSGKVPTTRTINGKALSSNISLTSSDVGALPDSTTIGDATLTIQKNGTTVDTFTANATSNKTINITVPTNTSELTNGAGFITASALNGYATQTWVGQQGFLTSTALSGYATETWVGQQGYITGITSTMVTNALGYTPYDASNPNGYTSNTGTVTSVNNVSPVSGNVTLSIPAVNNSTITITQGGVTKGSFTLNQSSGDTIALDAGGGSPLPSQTGHSGEFLTTDGTDASWTGITIPTVNDATLTIQQNGTTVDTFTANSSTNKTVNIKTEQFKLFHHDWFDYELNDQSWLRADTFSWQDGTVYTEAYNHLVADYNGGTSTTETVGSYTITYVLADDGHKITTDETNVTNIYNESGVAWYYILDTTNQRFKLPRENPAREELIDLIQAPVIGNGTTIGLQNSSRNLGLFNYGSNNKAMPGLAEAAYGASKGTTITPVGVYTPYQGLGLSSDATKSGMKADLSNLTSTSLYKGKKYLYFYVGQFSQSATEQTAGLNSELFNGKADIDLSNAVSNASASAKETISGWGKPSGTYENLTLAASGNTYTMTSNGFLNLVKGASSGQYIRIEKHVGSTVVYAVASISTNNSQCSLLVPVKKGDVIYVTYTASGTLAYFRVIKSEGEV